MLDVRTRKTKFDSVEGHLLLPYGLTKGRLIERGFKRGYAPFVVQEGSGTRSKGFPTVLSPISVRTEMGCLRGMSAIRAEI